MSLILHRIALQNFRKFRERHELGGLTNGLNVVVEPNETGKSTIMEAVRAALFLRHGSKTQLIKSFLPYGDNVGPQVELQFEVGGQRYELTKRFLSKPHIEFSGPGGRQEGEAAEEALQRLLHFEKQGHSLDAGGLGNLGLLWVPQTEGLNLVEPSDQVRDGIGGALEGQASAMLGSPKFDRIRDRTNQQYGRYKTATGKITGALKDLKEHTEKLAMDLKEAGDRKAALERNFDEVDQCRGQLRQVTIDLTDEGDESARSDLLARLEKAKAAVQTLETKTAQHDQAATIVGKLEELAQRHEDAERRRMEAAQKLQLAQHDHAVLIDPLTEAQRLTSERGANLDEVRTRRKTAQEALAQGRKQMANQRRQTALSGIRERYKKIIAFEQEHSKLSQSAELALTSVDLESLEQIETDLSRAQALIDAGGVRIEFTGALHVTMDGKPMPKGEIGIAAETVLDFGDDNRLAIRPPRSLESAAAELATAQKRRDDLLDRYGATSISDLRMIDRDAKDAAADLRSIAGQLEALTPADSELNLPAGTAALKLFVAELSEELGQATEAEVDEVRVPLADLEACLAKAETDYAGAEEANRLAIDDQRKAEKDENSASIAESEARSNLSAVEAEILRIAETPGFEELADSLAKAQIDLAERVQDLDSAKRNAATLDSDGIQRQINSAERRRANTESRRGELAKQIAALEAHIESDGGKGLAERVAGLAEELAAAQAKLARMELDAATLDLLRDVLAEAQDEVTRTLAGPVSQRAERYIHRIFPGSDPGFDTDLALATLTRGTVEEDAAGLSIGTQEQLAVMTRLAFAELLREKGKPVSLMLDDPLVYSDDVRLDAMIDLLAEAAEHMQIIILTCRDRAFRAASGTRISLKPEVA